MTNNIPFNSTVQQEHMAHLNVKCPPQQWPVWRSRPSQPATVHVTITVQSTVAQLRDCRQMRA